MKNILVVMPSAQLRGGAEESLLQYAAQRSLAGCSLTVVLLEHGPMVEALQHRGARVVVYDAGQLRQPHLWWKVIRQIKALAQREQSELILAWMTKGHLYSGPAGKLAGKPVIYFQHGIPDNGSVDRLCSVIPAIGAVCCSRFIAEQQQQKVKYPALPVPMAADLTRFAQVQDIAVEVMKTQLGFDPYQPLVGMVGRLQHWKGMHVFAAAFAALREIMPEVQGVIVGGPHELEPGYEASLKKSIEDLGVTDTLRLVGAQRNVPEWMQAMDVIVHASEREPFGIVIVEAMSLGKPVIATIPGGPAEIIEPNISGQLVTWNNTDELMQAMHKFLVDQDFAHQCGVAAKSRAQLFSTEIFAHNLDTALDELLSKNQARQK